MVYVPVIDRKKEKGHMTALGLMGNSAQYLLLFPDPPHLLNLMWPYLLQSGTNMNQNAENII